jgi:hypothetical protein
MRRRILQYYWRTTFLLSRDLGGAVRYSVIRSRDSGISWILT